MTETRNISGVIVEDDFDDYAWEPPLAAPRANSAGGTGLCFIYEHF